jgi:DNA-binding NarL/FixJ family response regulator
MPDGKLSAQRGLERMVIRVLLADDAKIMRQLIRELLEVRPDLEVVGEAGDFAQTMRMVSDLKPHVVVMDLHMPSGIGTAPADIKSRLESCGSKLLAISIWNDEESRDLARGFGALKLLNKMELRETLVPAILHLDLRRAEAK